MAASELFANAANSTLSAAITSTSATTLTVTSGSTFPASGNFRILVDTELMLVTGVSSNTFTVTRGIEGTTAATHLNLAPVTHVLTAASLIAAVGQMNLRGTFSSRPAAGIPGRCYYCSDSPFSYFDDGTTWQKYFGSYPLVTQPSQSTFTWDNQNAASAVDSNDMLVMTGDTSHNVGLYKTAPATPYNIDMGFLWASDPLASSSLLVGFRDTGSSNSGKLVVLDAAQQNSSYQFNTIKFTNLSTFSATYQSNNSVFIPGGMMFLRITDDGTNFKFSFSNDGINFVNYDSRSRTDFLTPANVFFGVTGTSKPNILSLFHWKVS